MLERSSKINNVNQFNPFGIDTPMAKKNVLKEILEFAIADSHIFAIEEVCYTITDDSNKDKPNWKLLDKFGDSSLCKKADKSKLPNKIFMNDKYKYDDLIKNDKLCEQYKEALIEYFKQ